MYAILTLQVAVGIAAADFYGAGLDACFVALLQVGDGCFVAVRLGIAQVHAHQHAGPVLAFGTTGTRVNLQYAVHLVGLFTEHVLQLERLDGFGSFAVGVVHLFLGDQLVLVEVEGQLQLIAQGLHLLVSSNPLLQSLYFLHLSLSCFLVVPKARGLGAELFLLHLDFLSFDVEVSVESFCTFLYIFQLIRSNHSVNGVNNLFSVQRYEK